MKSFKINILRMCGVTSDVSEWRGERETCLRVISKVLWCYELTSSWLNLYTDEGPQNSSSASSSFLVESDNGKYAFSPLLREQNILHKTYSLQDLAIVEIRWERVSPIVYVKPSRSEMYVFHINLKVIYKVEMNAWTLVIYQTEQSSYQFFKHAAPPLHFMINWISIFRLLVINFIISRAFSKEFNFVYCLRKLS